MVAEAWRGSRLSFDVAGEETEVLQMAEVVVEARKNEWERKFEMAVKLKQLVCLGTTRGASEERRLL
jgi:hypothetical protein